MVAELIRLRLEEAREWSRSILGGFLLELQAETLDDEAYLSLCRETGRLSDLVAKLLALRRVEEAITEASRAHDYELIALADMFVRQDYNKVAEGLVRERIDTSWGLHFLDWLIEFHKNEGDIPEALVLAGRRFWQRPSMETYVEMRGLATTLARWSDLRSEILNRLAREELHGVRVEIFVEEGEIDLALEVLEQVKPEDHYWGYQYHNLGLRVAAAAETERPNAAIHLYLQRPKG